VGGTKIDRLLPASLGFVSVRGLLAAVGTIIGASALIGLGGAFVLGVVQVGGPRWARSESGGPTPAPSTATEVETFDSMPVGAGTDASWNLAGDADVVATTATGDRSLRLRTSRSGAEAIACRPLPRATTSTMHLEFDLLVGKATTAARRLSLNAGSDVLLALKVDPDGTVLIGPPAPSPSPSGGPSTETPHRWQRVAIDVDPRAHRVTWSEVDPGSGPVASGKRAVPGLERLPGGTVCLHSPKDTPAGWIAVDNLSIE